jgi:hypothetical protein
VRRRSITIAIGLLVAAMAIAVGTPYVFDGREYANVPSIEAQADYRSEAKLVAAWSLPVAVTYPKPLVYQNNPSFCGPASVANVLRSLGVEATQEGLVERSQFRRVFGLLIGGLTLDELAGLITSQTPHRVTVLRDLTLAQFREHLRSVNDVRYRYVANFHRGPLFGRGHGHFSPLLGYLETDDLVLVGDVNDEYRPFLVRSEALWRAVDTVDSASEKKRGLILIDVVERQ